MKVQACNDKEMPTTHKPSEDDATSTTDDKEEEMWDNIIDNLGGDETHGTTMRASDVATIVMISPTQS